MSQPAPMVPLGSMTGHTLSLLQDGLSDTPTGTAAAGRMHFGVRASRWTPNLVLQLSHLQPKPCASHTVSPAAAKAPSRVPARLHSPPLGLTLTSSSPPTPYCKLPVESPPLTLSYSQCLTLNTLPKCKAKMVRCQAQN